MEKSKKTASKSKTQEEKSKPKKAKKTTADKKRVALVRIRGGVHLRHDIEETLEYLNLGKSNSCVVIDTRAQYKGMIQKVNDYVTWGEISKDTLKKLFETRGKLKGGQKIDDGYLKEKTPYKSIEEFADAFMNFSAELKAIPDVKAAFTLSPPKKGFERKGIKKPYTLGGALGYRGEDINQLIERMI